MPTPRNDLERVSELARRMVCQYGMSEALGMVCHADSRQEYFLGDSLFSMEPFSEETARLVDREVRAIVDGQRQRARKLLEEKRELLETVAGTLLEKEVLDREEFQALVGLRKEEEKAEEGE